MKASTRKRQIRERRRQVLEEARTLWHNEEMGVRLEEVPPKGGRGAARQRITWTTDSDPFVTLMGLTRARGVLREFEHSYVVQARLAGVAWDEIGWALEITGSAARKRWPEVDAEAEALLAEEAS